MTKTSEAKLHINIDVSADIAKHIRNQPHQGRYIEDLVRRDMAKDESLAARIEALENNVHQKHIRIDGLDFRLFGENYLHRGNSIIGYSFNLGDQPLETLTMRQLADSKTMRSFAFRNELGHFVGRAILKPRPDWPGFELEIETISRIGDKLYSASEMPDELARTTFGWDNVGQLNRLEMLTYRMLKNLVPPAILNAALQEIGIDKDRLENFTSF